MRRYFLFLLLLPGFAGRAQSPLEDYVRMGLENNLSLKQKEIDYRQSVEALREARGLFYPSITFNARYSVAEGGRTIDLPIGDLLNPVYSTLNQLIHKDAFPPIGNQSFMFLRPQEQETKIRLIQPLFNTDIHYQARIREELVNAGQVTVDQYRQELVAEIKKAWYRVAMTDGIVNMLNDSRKLLEENLRVNQKLAENGKITIDHVYRAETELSKFDQEIQASSKNREVATAYFNFLLNRGLSEPVILAGPDRLPVFERDSSVYRRSALSNREELKKLDVYGTIADLQLKMNRSGGLPTLMIVADYGIQGEKYRFNKDATFGQASAVLTWDLFGGFRNRSKIRQAQIRKESIDRQKDEAEKQIELQVVNALSTLTTDLAGIESANSQVRSAREGFRLVNRRYGEGQASLIEFLDARTTLTQAEENLIISRFTYLSDYADFEKVCSISAIK